MANAITNLIVPILSDAVLEAFTVAIAPLARFSTNVGVQPSQRGNTVKVPFVPSQGQTVKKFTGVYQVDDISVEGIDVPLSEHDYVSMGLTDIEQTVNTLPDVSKIGNQLANKLAKTVFQKVLAPVKAANYPAQVAAGAAFGFDQLIEIKDECDSKNMPELGRVLVIDTMLYNRLIGESRAAYYLGSTEAIREARLGRIAGFDLIPSTIIPDNGEDLKGYAAVSDAMLFANRYLVAIGETLYNEARPLAMEGGATLGYLQWHRPEARQQIAIYECLYGSLKGNSDALVRVVGGGSGGNGGS